MSCTNFPDNRIGEIHLNLLEQSKNINMNLPDEIMNAPGKMVNQIENIQKNQKNGKTQQGPNWKKNNNDGSNWQTIFDT